MTIDDLFLEQQLSRMNELDTAWARFQSEALDMRAEHRGVRGMIASLFVRFGVWLDRSAGERVIRPKRFEAAAPTPQQTEGHHAISW